jgi:hypothetical protein
MERQRAAMPFVHLERDLWDLRDSHGKEITPDVRESARWLLGHGAVGQLRPDVTAVLADRATLVAAARLLLDQHFTPVLSEMICAAVGLDLLVLEAPRGAQGRLRRPRASGFAEEVLRAGHDLAPVRRDQPGRPRYRRARRPAATAGPAGPAIRRCHLRQLARNPGLQEPRPPGRMRTKPDQRQMSAVGVNQPNGGRIAHRWMSRATQGPCRPSGRSQASARRASRSHSSASKTTRTQAQPDMPSPVPCPCPPRHQRRRQIVF